MSRTFPGTRLDRRLTCPPTEQNQAGLLAQPCNRWQKDLRHQHLLAAQGMQGTPGPQVTHRHARCAGNCPTVQNITGVQAAKFDRPPPEAWKGKQQRTQRARSQTGHPAPETSPHGTRQGRVGKNHRHPITLQHDLTYPGEWSKAADTQAFDGQRPGLPGTQQTDTKLPALPLATGRQRAGLGQPGGQWCGQRAGRQPATPGLTTAHWPRGACASPPRRMPGLMPRWANQPRFISSA